MRRAARRIPEIMLIACAIAIIVRLTVRDRWPLISTLFYATPPLVLAVTMGIAGGLGLALRKRSLGVSGVAGAAICLAWFFLASHEHHEPPVESGFRGILWNLSRGSRGWDRIAEAVRSARPDLAIFVEAGSDAAARSRFVMESLPGHDHAWLEGGMGIAVKGKVLATRSVRLGSGGRAATAQVSLGGKEFAVVIVDLWANPFRSRRDAFEHLHDLLGSMKPEPLIVAGDFNTPHDSVFFDTLRGEMTHAFEAAGNGFHTTWPLPVPVMAIDHVWGGRAVRFLNCGLKSGMGSDHRAVTFEFRCASP